MSQAQGHPHRLGMVLIDNLIVDEMVAGLKILSHDYKN